MRAQGPIDEGNHLALHRPKYNLSLTAWKYTLEPIKANFGADKGMSSFVSEEAPMERESGRALRQPALAFEKAGIDFHTELRLALEAFVFVDFKPGSVGKRVDFPQFTAAFFAPAFILHVDPNARFGAPRNRLTSSLERYRSNPTIYSRNENAFRQLA